MPPQIKHLNQITNFKKTRYIESKYEDYVPILVKATRLPIDVLKIICKIAFNPVFYDTQIKVKTYQDPICENGLISQHLNIIINKNVNYIVCITRCISLSIRDTLTGNKSGLRKCLLITFGIEQNKDYTLDDFRNLIVYENGYLSKYCYEKSQ